MHLTHSDDPSTVGNEAVRVLHTRNTTECALTYATVLNWPVVDGHRYRRHAGCTCHDDPNSTGPCHAPGAHPRPGPISPLAAQDIAAAFDSAPGAGIIVPCSEFDAVTVPRDLGLALMHMLDRFNTHAPCMTADHGQATVLVAPGTGRTLAGITAALVHTGPDAWIALPPSHGTRWDTPPAPHSPPPHALTIRSHLERVVALAKRSGDLPGTGREGA
ncbi:hypothetical protein ACFQ7J_21910 [Streptomyces sp. NPDC056501]|uniref:hypothetical protein n=1 Tax=Streptomyces sp. NPDC056501 TaxID=3345841 RepID=UPI00368F28E6